MQENQNEEIIAPDPKPFKCPNCNKAFKIKWQLNRHDRQVHEKRERKYMKHIKKGRKFVCSVCSKEFTHPQNLKTHILKEHQVKDLKAKNIDPELVLAEPIKKPKLRHDMTDLEEIKEDRMIMAGVKVSR